MFSEGKTEKKSSTGLTTKIVKQIHNRNNTFCRVLNPEKPSEGIPFLEMDLPK